MSEKMSLEEFLNHNAPSEDAIEEIAFNTLSKLMGLKYDNFLF